VDTAGGLVLTWIRRSRRGWAWLDDVDAPLGEREERYGVRIVGARGTLERECTSPRLHVPAPELAVLGTGALTLEVRQIGDLAASHPTIQQIDFAQEQPV
jgi:hypothetical protein